MKTTCDGCGRPIFFAWTEAGKKMPLDPTPVPEPVQGTYVVTGQTCRAAEPMFDPPGTIYHLCHWATCDTPDSFRSKKP